MPICSRASDYGLMKIDDTGRILHFAEKPKGSDLEAMVGNIDAIIVILLNFFCFLSFFICLVML